MSLDYGGSDDEADPKPAKDLSSDDLAKAATGQDSAEVLDRITKLFEAQRQQYQALLAKAEEDSQRANLVEDMFRTILSDSPLKVLPLLEEATSTTIMKMQDANGLNLLHQAVRVGSYEIVDKLLSLNPNLCDQLTSPMGRPAHWTPFMVFVDTQKGVMNQETFFYILGQLLYHSSLATLEAQAANGSSALHMMCAKGMTKTVKKTVYAIYNKAGESEAALGLSVPCSTGPMGAAMAVFLGLYVDAVTDRVFCDAVTDQLFLPDLSEIPSRSTSI